MRKRALLIIASIALVMVLGSLSWPVRSTVEAGLWWQDAPRLDGYHIYFSESASEPSRFDRSGRGVSRFAGLLELLGADLYTLEWRTGVPPDADLVIIPGPLRDLTDDQTAWLWVYLSEGGRLLLLTEPPFGDYRAYSARSALTVLMWTDMGLRGHDDILLLQNAPLPAEGATAGAAGAAALQLDFLTNRLNTEHPITAPLTGELAFFGARTLDMEGTPREAQVTALVWGNSDWYGEANYNQYLNDGILEYNINADTPPGDHVLAAAMQDAETGARVVLVGDADFARNGYGLKTAPDYSSAFVYPDNARFLVNSVAWLVGTDTVWMDFPPPGPTATPTVVPSPTPPPADDGSAS